MMKIKNKEMMMMRNEKLCFSNLYFLYSLLLIFFLVSLFHILFYSSTTTHSSSTPSSSHHFVVKRSFRPLGSGAYLFIQMGAYRGGLNTFAVVGLASKPIHVYSNPDFRCRWIPHNRPHNHVHSTYSSKLLPDWGYGRIYTVVVVNCTFSSTVNSDNSGGQLVITATSRGSGVGGREEEIEFVALEEPAGSVNMSVFTSPPKYEYMYCGPTLYGDVSPQWVREWMAYHVMLFGSERSHFVMHDAGGVREEVMEVLRPWIEEGVVSLRVEDVREQERFDGYYHNQFLVLNDCFHRYRYMAKWIFFFDLDEFLYVDMIKNNDGKGMMDRMMKSMSNYTQVTFEQIPMSDKLCPSSDIGHTDRMWGIEKLVYRCLKLGIKGRNRKYAIQPRNAFAVGIHDSRNFEGKSTQKNESSRMKYFHYIDTIDNREEPCTEFVNASEVFYDSSLYVCDERVKKLAASVKQFEIDKIGKRLMGTRQ